MSGAEGISRRTENALRSPELAESLYTCVGGGEARGGGAFFFALVSLSGVHENSSQCGLVIKIAFLSSLGKAWCSPSEKLRSNIYYIHVTKGKKTKS